MSEGKTKPLPIYKVKVTLDLYCSKDNLGRFYDHMIEKASKPADVIAILNDCSDDNDQIWINSIYYEKQAY